jgi:hypothetical protein
MDETVDATRKPSTNLAVVTLLIERTFRLQTPLLAAFTKHKCFKMPVHISVFDTGHDAATVTTSSENKANCLHRSSHRKLRGTGTTGGHRDGDY